MKASSRDSNSSVDIAFDRNGNKFDGEGLLAEVYQRRVAKFGLTYEDLYYRLEKIEDEFVGVVIWPKIDSDYSLYDKSTTEPESALVSEIETLKYGLKAQITQFDAPIQNHPRIAVAYTPLTARYILYHDPNAILDASLGEDIKIARADNAEAIG